ncbi:MAG: hypothetical protein EDM05_025205 [Leptolyngbya sp. IPPAS B-1204]|uniref:Uncharacterized protein n=1 Tax=Leptolyngbya sp. NK1-12 TaxID=2547451 RepID=A0AA96WD17_9CYAN|nr:hypothetical protein [Leptolyngbya sp. NK1-12]MBF2051200.1 hypothetical protein [Elainella sp. C42_A2020_010]RNJ66085.1 MAG: hypothetical protein EDM05_27920 [Leptolyngbya sp. IPPAS B-1204]WNZ22988.1 hypothetical protein HJG54_09020 [Leptolyngbya sp. NK1-12]
MHSQSDYTQLTFYYLNGQTESFMIPAALEDETRHDMRIEVRHILQKDWWILNLDEQTVMVNIANVVKVEVKPSLTQLQGEGIFSNAERITALNRSR